jgi:peptidoglycan/LPS O-acetylase OafA/YrhL
MISAVVFGILVFVLFRAQGPLRTAFNWAPVRWLGNMSYSYYLIHALVINAAALVLLKVVSQTAPQAVLFWVLMPFVFLATFVVSTLLFMFVEKPFSLVARKKYSMPPTAEALAP